MPFFLYQVKLLYYCVLLSLSENDTKLIGYNCNGDKIGEVEKKNIYVIITRELIYEPHVGKEKLDEQLFYWYFSEK